MILYIDLDDVCCDFTTAACEIHGVKRQEVENHRREGEWSMVRALSIATGRMQPMTLDEFWKPIDRRGEEFWTNLKPTLHLAELMNEAKDRNLLWYILTSPSLHPSSYSGKIAWIRRRMGNCNKVVMTAHKHLLAGSNTILVDDRPDNVEQFISHGGRGILFPTVGNCMHHHAKNPLPYVKEQLDACCNRKRKHSV